MASSVLVARLFSGIHPSRLQSFCSKNLTITEIRKKSKQVPQKFPGKNALIFCTYSGPHTGLNEATPVGKYVGQFFEHLGFIVLDKWYVLSEFHCSEERSTKGRMGNIRGKPTEEELQKIRRDAKKLASKL